MHLIIAAAGPHCFLKRRTVVRVDRREAVLSVERPDVLLSAALEPAKFVGVALRHQFAVILLAVQHRTGRQTANGIQKRSLKLLFPLFVQLLLKSDLFCHVAEGGVEHPALRLRQAQLDLLLQPAVDAVRANSAESFHNEERLAEVVAEGLSDTLQVVSMNACEGVVPVGFDEFAPAAGLVWIAVRV